MVSFPIGGMKTPRQKGQRRGDRGESGFRPDPWHVLAITNTSSKYAKPTVVGLRGIMKYALYVTIATPARERSRRSTSRPNWKRTPGCYSSECPAIPRAAMPGCSLCTYLGSKHDPPSACPYVRHAARLSNRRRPYFGGSNPSGSAEDCERGRFRAFTRV